MRSERLKKIIVVTAMTLLLTSSLLYAEVEEFVELDDLVAEALRNNHDILIAESKWKQTLSRIPQVKTLPDPMVMIGYQNETWRRYTFGEMEGAQWMFSASQEFPFPGKLGLKGKMTEREAESLEAALNVKRLEIIAKVKTAYYDLFLIHKSLALLEEKKSLLDRIEKAVGARYTAGMAPQQEVLMTQVEKSMLLERKEMLQQRRQSIETLINTLLSRSPDAPLGRPMDIKLSKITRPLEVLKEVANKNSPELRMKDRMIGAGETAVEMAKREFYPDLTLTGSVYERRKDFQDMWSLTLGIKIPLYFKTKQRNMVREANSALSTARHDYEGAMQMVLYEIRDNYLMATTAERLMNLYTTGLIPQASLTLQSAMASYSVGKVELITLLKNLTTLLDYELQYWSQLVEHEKAVARLEAATGVTITERQATEQRIQSKDVR